ncbi:uncharacterized protein JCM6883_002522 [Sporobolomyces salmoneus]|uniref:uncharacterized protein n=1 Tax=Sporobolomyces salmoneus TaxID=183962 RepID=UPI00316F6F69
MNDDELPPLPPPLPPTHSRSFSSSSSSSADSPRSQSNEWARRVTSDRGGNRTTRDTERQEEEENRSTTTRENERGAVSSSYSMRPTRSQASSEGSPAASIRDPDYVRSTPTIQDSRSSPFSSSTSSSLAEPSSTSQQLQQTRASSFLSKVSPSLNSHSRYSNSPSNIASLGLRGSPEPLGLGIGSNGSFSRHLSGLPSPPPTNSDEGSTEGGSRYGTVRASEVDNFDSREGPRSQDGSASPSKPDRPPKSERRLTWTPTKDDQNLPEIGRTSPTIVLDSNRTRREGTEQSGGFRRSASVASFARNASPSPRSGLTPSNSSRSVDGNHSDAMEELSERFEGLEPRRRLKARTNSSDADSILSSERRRETSQRAKNQRILDSINSQIDPLASPPASNRGISPSPSSSDFNPSRVGGGGVQRSSTSSTIRKLAAAGEDDLLQGTMPNFSTYGSTDEDDEPRQAGVPKSMEEFGMIGDSPMRRSATVGDISSASQGVRSDRERRSQTSGYQSRPRTSLTRRNLEDDERNLPERSATSTSYYPSTIERIRARRSDLVGSDRTRAASSFSDTRQQDQDFSEGMRRLASQELLRTPRDRSKSQLDSLDSPSPASLPKSLSNDNNSPPTTLRNRPALPSEFRPSPSTSSISSVRRTPRRSLDASTARLTPSSSSSRDLDRFTRSRSAVPSLDSPTSPSTSTSSVKPSHRQARSEVSFEDDYSAKGRDEDEKETTPKSAKKSTFDRISSVGRARTSLGYTERRTNTVSELLDRPYSRTSREARRSGTRSPDTASRGTATPPLPSSARSEGRFNDSVDLSARKERFRKAEVGSDAWMAELDSVRKRGTRPRTSGSSVDDRSTTGEHPARSASEAERDRTVRAINALLAGQGIVAVPVDSSSPSSTSFSTKDTSPRKRESYGGYDRSRKISFANGTREDSPLPPGSNSMSRTNSNTSRSESDPVIQSVVASASSGDHHKLLLSAFEHFDRHFSSQGGTETPESIQLVDRMIALISSTTKLNTGIRSLSDLIKEEQIQAQLDEGQRDPTVSLTQFEKSVHALLRTSDDQVRSLSEDLIAITRVDRERERLRNEQGGGSNRPLSRLSNPQQSPSKPRPTTAGSVLEGATVSLSSSRSPNVSREVLRNPLEDPTDPLPPSRRNTLNFSGRSPFGTVMTDSPTPASRRSGSTSETPLRQGSISTSSTYSSGTTSRYSTRRAKTSVSSPVVSLHCSLRSFFVLQDPNRSPTQTGAVPFPTATSTVPMPRVDSTPALSNESPTRNATSFPRRPLDGPPRTYSGASGDAIAYEALELAANMDEARTRAEREAALDRLETIRTESPNDERRSIVSATPTSESRRPRTRSSMGAIGSALKNAFTPKKKGVSESPAGISSSASSQFSFTRESSDSIRRGGEGGGAGRDDRRREVENILRRSASRT